MRCTRLFMRLFTRLSVIWLLLFAATTGSAEPYQLILEDIRSPGVNVYVAVYSAQASGWDSEPLLQLRETLPDTQSATVALPLATGAYAIRALVDLAGNGELATNERGRPVEPFAISVGAGRRQPSTHFSRSIFQLHEGQPEVTLTLRYPVAASDRYSARLQHLALGAADAHFNPGPGAVVQL